MKATLLSTIALLLFYLQAAGQGTTFQVFPITKYNGDKTLRLDYVVHTEEETNLYITYTTNNAESAFTGIYLNDFRIVDKKKGTEYRPTFTGHIPQNTGGNFYIHNNAGEMTFQFTFDRLPASVINIDILESTGDPGVKYNFTFRNINLELANAQSNFDEEWLDDIQFPFLKSFYSKNDLTIDVSIEGFSLGKIDRHFNRPEYKPSCAEYGTFSVVFPSSTTKKRRFYGTASKNGRKYTWDFEFSTELHEDYKCTMELTVKN